MKKIVSLLICLSLCLTAFSACGKKSSTSAAASSGAESTASAVPPSVSSAPTVQSESTAASSSVSSEIAPVDGHKVSASIQVANENRLGVLTLTVPETWTYDTYATFTQDNIKVADLAALWKTENPSIPFTVEMTDGFAHPESGDGPQYPEGFGLQQTLDRTVGGHGGQADSQCRPDACSAGDTGLVGACGGQAGTGLGGG